MSNKSWKNWLPVLLLLIICVGVFVFYFVQGSSFGSQLSDIEKKIVSTRADEQAQILAQDEAVSSIAKNVNGYDVSRVARDDKFIVDLFEKYLTFDNEAEYIANRDDIIAKYGDVLSENFVNDYFIPISDTIDENGKRVEFFGDALNMSYLNCKPYLISMDDDIYTYFAFVTVSTVGKGHGFSGDGLSLFKYSIDSDGNLLKFDGYIVDKY